MIRKNIFVLIQITVVVLFSGCAKQPDNFPKIYPCEVTVLNDNTPESGVMVRLRNQENDNLSMTGITNAHGKAVVRSMIGTYSRPGAPEGSFKIILDKPLKTGQELPDSKIAKMSKFEFQEYKNKIATEKKKMLPIVPVECSDIATTKLTIDVSPSRGVKTTIELDDYKKKK